MSKERLEPTGQSILNICGGQNATVTKPKIGDFKGKIPENKKFLEKFPRKFHFCYSFRYIVSRQRFLTQITKSQFRIDRKRQLGRCVKRLQIRGNEY